MNATHLLVGGFFVAIGAFKLYLDYAFFFKASRSTGRFRGWAQSTFGDSTVYWLPIVVFITQEGKEIEFTSPSGYTPKPRFKIDDPIEVLYDPANPKSARAYRPLLFWAMSFGFIFLGLLIGASP
jgi:hypothetical protein